MLNYNREKKVRMIWLVYYFILIFIICFRNLNNPGIWFDEGGQFWMAKGLNHFSNINEPIGDLSSLLENNRNFNFDPGGFTLLLRFWTFFMGNSIISLRFLPFIFLIISAFFFIKILKDFKLNLWVVNLGPSLFLLSKDILHFGFTIRAYSMEICGIICSVWLISRFIKYKRNTDLIYFFIVLSVFAFSRYGFFLQIISCISLLVYFNFSSICNLFKNKIFVFGFILLIISITTIYFNSLFYHLSITKFKGPDYAYKTTLYAQSFREGLKIFIRNFTYLRVLPFLILILLFTLSKLYKSIPSFQKYNLLLIYMFIYTSYSIFFSLLGLYPWDISNKNSLPFQFFSILSICILLDWSFSFLRYKWLILTYSLLIMIILSLSFNRGLKPQDYSYLMYKNCKNIKQTWVDITNYPVLKYQIKYGVLNKHKNLYYPLLTNDKFDSSYKYLIIHIPDKTKINLALKPYNIKKYIILKNVMNDYMIEIKSL